MSKAYEVLLWLGFLAVVVAIILISAGYHFTAEGESWGAVALLTGLVMGILGVIFWIAGLFFTRKTNDD